MPAFFLLAAYALSLRIWEPRDLLTALRLVTLLWLFPAALVYSFVRRECVDAIEAVVISAVSGLVLATASYFVITTLGVRVPGLQALWPAPIIACGFAAMLRLNTGLRHWWASSGRLCGVSKFDWTLAALLAGSLCVTARFQKSFEPVPENYGSKFVLNGDQTFFASIAYELKRNTPPRQHPMRAGAPDRAYHHLAHLTLTMSGIAGGESDLLRLHLVILYSVIVLLHSMLVFCLGRALSGGNAGAGWLAVWLLFIAAIPFEPLGPVATPMFYFVPFPQGTSTVEPTVLTSPQMFYGLIPANASLLCLFVAWRNTRNGRPAFASALLSAVLVALTLRFRVHCFLVLAPVVLGSLLLLACSFRKAQLLAAVGISLALVWFQHSEMQLPSYAPMTQRVYLGLNRIVFFKPLYSAWPGAAPIFKIVQSLFGESSLGEAVWSGVCMILFCVCNMIGIPMTIAIGACMRRLWRSPSSRVLSVTPLVLLVPTVVLPSIIQVGYDRFSVGGQIPFHLGWYLLPFAAAGLWPGLTWLHQRAGLERSSAWFVWCVTLALVGWQTIRGPSPAERKNLAESPVFSADELATVEFVRRETPADAVVLTGILKSNFALWSGLAGRRTFLEYIPVGQILDVVLAPENRVEARVEIIERLHATTDEREFRALVRNSKATHIIEATEFPLRLHPPDCLLGVYASPSGRLRVWQVLDPAKNEMSR